MKHLRPLFCLLLAAWATNAVAAVPVIAPPVNQASYVLPGLPGYGIAQGAMFAVFGTEMGPAELAGAPSLPLSTDLAGTSVQVTVNGQTRDCFMIFTSAGQLAAILPSDTPLGEGQITVTYNGMTSEPQPILVVEHAVGMFTVSQDGKGPAVITDANFVPVSYIHSLAPGDVGIAWVTGLGARSADDGPAEATDFTDLYDIEIGVGGISARILYAGPSGCCAALDQIVFEVPGGGTQGTAQAIGPSDPENKRTGCGVPTVIKVGDTLSQWTSVAVSDDGPICGDIHGLDKELISQLSSQESLTLLSARAVGATSFAGDSLDSEPLAGLALEKSARDQLGAESYFLQAQSLEFLGLNSYSPPTANKSCAVTVPGGRGPGSSDIPFSVSASLGGMPLGMVALPDIPAAALSARPDMLQLDADLNKDGQNDASASFMPSSNLKTAPLKTQEIPMQAFVEAMQAGVLDGNWMPLGEFLRQNPDLIHLLSFRYYYEVDGKLYIEEFSCANAPLDNAFTLGVLSHLGDPFALEAVYTASDGTFKMPFNALIWASLEAQRQIFATWTTAIASTLLLTAALQSANLPLSPDEGRAWLGDDSGPTQSTGSCNVSVNNLGVAAGCSFNLANVTGWGFWAVGSDQPFVTGSLQGETQFSTALGLQNWVEGQAAPPTIPDLASDGQVEIRIFSETETISGVLMPTP